jgi:hypothetical protein
VTVAVTSRKEIIQKTDGYLECGEQGISPSNYSILLCQVHTHVHSGSLGAPRHSRWALAGR